MSIKKTDNFFVISNYQHDPTHLLDYCDQYIIYEQTNINEIIYDYKKLNVIHSKHSGHNISDYFQYFIDNYENLPETIALIKGNVFPRHYF